MPDAITVALVHGAFADSSSWNGVIERLQAKGVRVSAIVNPLRGIAIDSEYVAGALQQIPGPVVAVGHSYGGAVMSNAATGADNVVGLVFVAAFATDEGERLGGGLSMFGRDWQPAEATIIEAISEAKMPKNIIGQPNVGYESWPYQAVVEVRPEGVKAFRTEMGIPKPVEHFKFPKSGPVGVLFDPKSRKVKWDRDDPRVYSDQDEAKRRRDLDAALRAPAGSQPVVEPHDDVAKPNEDGNKSIEQARKVWRENLKQGYCTQKEFDNEMRKLDQA
jgi:pimeloyl-ACP methyl ester carboxylesterase